MEMFKHMMLEYCSYLVIKLVPWNLSLGKKKMKSCPEYVSI